MEKYLYLTLDVLSLAFPLMFSFYRKAPFYKKWKYLFPAILITASIFIVWDEIFTYMGVWGFNPRYLTGLYIGALPIEEILFFICIPYACVFTYFALCYLIEKDYLFPHQELISSLLILLLLVMGMFYFEKLYTGITFVLLGLLLAYQMLKLRPRYMGRFYFSYGFILIPFFLINGILTGSFIDEEVVWYNNNENLGIRIGTIPFEDAFYGMLMILMNIVIFEYLQDRERYKALMRS
ncbi:lycopene cyclase domain-containing protein [Ohtaekwangia koreensis]|uniref:Lycopene cyclase domain-containing protein n=1 Tax=Ohtaekwangia koreensis TaxID=688867 RepID=A0A1T5MEZ1_9BACT|nr:lycopene cyclase domain-containing protein [Ohtaekwangia koreensis]SKC86762.1 lycopene cyclase domain-containing protein [Ohtaekwangia koreensis]